ncbi:discoidin, CUB and LCCL domain-containing protein 2-like isoform X2 [Acropora muricata]|uniref:discoidin, CUB and LCCL domain-containing protein 2-like isoform X2 n=1 Tax=Acropora muricata TaxID=159855 RepID=UPI0034E43C47
MLSLAAAIVGLSEDCNAALGLEDLKIQDSQLTAQSYYESLSIGGRKSVDTHPRCARLNNNYCAWCGPHGNGQYLQVDLRHDFVITGIATQGFEALSDYYVINYNFSHSRDGHTWNIFPLLLRGNHDGRSVERHTFIPPMYARYIRVHPMAYNNRICLRMELYGCSNSSSVLSTTPSPTTRSASSNTTAENVLLITKATAESSTEKSIIIHSTTDHSVGSGRILITTPRVKESQPSERHSLQTGSVPTEKARNDSKTMITVIIVVVIAVVIIFITTGVICKLVRKRKRDYHCRGNKIEEQLP